MLDNTVIENHEKSKYFLGIESCCFECKSLLVDCSYQASLPISVCQTRCVLCLPCSFFDELKLQITTA